MVKIAGSIYVFRYYGGKMAWYSLVTLLPVVWGDICVWNERTTGIIITFYVTRWNVQLERCNL